MLTTCVIDLFPLSLFSDKDFDSIDWHYFPSTMDSNFDGTMVYKTRWATECVYACATNVLPNCKSAHWRRSGRTCRLSPRDRMSTTFTLKNDYYQEMYEKYIPGQADFVFLRNALSLLSSSLDFVLNFIPQNFPKNIN